MAAFDTPTRGSDSAAFATPKESDSAQMTHLPDMDFSDSIVVMGLHGSSLRRENLTTVPKELTLHYHLAADMGHCSVAYGNEWELYRNAYNFAIENGATPQELVRIFQHVGVVDKAHVIEQQMEFISKKMTPHHVKSYGMNYFHNVTDYIDQKLSPDDKLKIIIKIGGKKANSKFIVGENFIDTLLAGRKYFYLSELLQLFVDNGEESVTLIGLQCMQTETAPDGFSQAEYNEMILSKHSQSFVLSPLLESKQLFNDIVSPILRRWEAAKVAAEEAALAEAAERMAIKKAEALKREPEMRKEMTDKIKSRKQDKPTLYSDAVERMKQLMDARRKADEQVVSISNELESVLIPRDLMKYLSPSTKSILRMYTDTPYSPPPKQQLAFSPDAGVLMPPSPPPPPPPPDAGVLLPPAPPKRPLARSPPKRPLTSSSSYGGTRRKRYTKHKKKYTRHRKKVSRKRYSKR